MARGLTSEETAKKLGINAKTVSAHRAGLLIRLNAANAPHAVYLAVKKGLIR
jgi:DNA-binding CsgD family transcriptional regulator